MGPSPGLSSKSDQDVIRSILEGNADAYRELHDRYQRRIYLGILRVVRDPDAAQDITQNTLLRMYQELPRYRPEYPFWPWLRTIARNTAFDEIRRQQLDTRKRQEWLNETSGGRRLTEGVPAIDQTSSDPFNVDVASFRQELAQALPQLQELYRRCYERRDLERQSYEDIAKELHMSEATARKTVNRARRALQQILGSIRRFLLEKSPV
jgi:RNA polymerase sigma-70 factor (ECF subfamily)